MQKIYLDNRDGFGFRDLSKAFSPNGDAFVQHTKNEPQLFSFYVTENPACTEWTIPKRGAYVKFIDDKWESQTQSVPDGVIFTGFITEDPQPVFLGQNHGNVWSYKVDCTSEEFLANSKPLPAGTYFNKTRGFILTDLLTKMFAESVPFPFNTAGIRPGGTEELFQVDTGQSWSDLAATFAAADGFNYWILDSYVYYGPDHIVTTYNNPKYLLAIDQEDPRFTPTRLNIKRVARDIVNDVTVLGEDEPADIVREHFVSDGYQGSFNLAFEPFGLSESKLVEDDFSSDSIDTTTWQEQDTFDDYIQAFEGALNVIGGPGNPASSSDPRTVFLLARKPIELKGVIEFRDGEIYFPPSPTGTGYIGGLYEDTSLSLDKLWNGWFLDLNNNKLQPVQDGVVLSSTYVLVPTRHYILRRTIQVDRQVGSSQEYTQYSTRKDYKYDLSVNPNVVLSWVVEEINDEDPNDVFTTTTTLFKIGITDTPPSFVLYAPVVPNDCHVVMNYVSVHRPQQAVLTVNDKPIKLGSFLDGGRAVLQADNGNGKLLWYSIPGNALDYGNTVLGDAPTAFWRMQELSGTTRLDSAGGGHPGTAVSTTGLAASPLNGDDNDYANTFGASSNINGDAFLVGTQASYEAWFKTSSGATTQTIWSSRDNTGVGDFLSVVSGKIFYGSDDLSGHYSTKTGLNDGLWHHVVWTIATAGTNNSKLYIDGVLDSQFTGTKAAKTNAWMIGHDLWLDTAAPGTGHFIGDLDEIAIYNDVILTPPQVLLHYHRALSSTSTVVTVPKAGSSVDLTYYRKQQASARLKSQTSIKAERERYRDDGIRKKIIRADDIKPKPRTSQECLALARAYLYDASQPRFEGEYTIEVLEDSPTELLFWPKPGDQVSCSIPLGEDDINTLLTIQSVNSSFLGKGSYSMRLGFGPINRWDTVIRDLILKRKSSFDDPIIADSDTQTLESIDDGTPYPGDLLDCTLKTVDATSFVFRFAQGGVPADVVYYEIRTDDTGWGHQNTGFVAWFRDTIVPGEAGFLRTKRDARYFIRPFNAAGKYARRSAVLRIAAPMANTTIMAGVTGDINSERARVVVPLPRYADYLGIRIQQYNAGGVTYYQGNGDQHVVLSPGVSVLLSAGFMTVDIPNPGFFDAGPGISSVQLYVNSYNLLNLYGTAQTVMIGDKAAGAWDDPPFNAADFTGSGSMTWTVDAGDVVTYRFTKTDKTITLSFQLDNTTIAGTPDSTLQIALPNGWTAAQPMLNMIAIWDNGSPNTGTIEVGTLGTKLLIKRLDGANFSASTNNTKVLGQFVFEIT